MASKRKKEVDQHVVRDTMLKANTAALKSFESVEAEIKSKKARTGKSYHNARKVGTFHRLRSLFYAAYQCS